VGVIRPEDALARYTHGDWRFVDCRFDLASPAAGRRAWEIETIAGAAYADLDRDLSGPVVPGRTGRHPLPPPTAAAAWLTEIGISRDHGVIAFDDRGGPFAARLWWTLLWLGHSPERVWVLDGGLTDWAGPRAPGRAAMPGPGYVPEVQPSRVASAAAVLQRGSSAPLIDARSGPRHRGEEEPIDTEAGHIPGAVNRPWTENLREGRFRSSGDLRTRFVPVVGDDASAVIVYCGSGVTACHDLLALEHAELGLGRLYAGSWSEWITDPARPRAP
jgi:thiosulfate/3-mercaptopyruvate sulfurtransferase